MFLKSSHFISIIKISPSC